VDVWSVAVVSSRRYGESVDFSCPRKYTNVTKLIWINSRILRSTVITMIYHTSFFIHLNSMCWRWCKRASTNVSIKRLSNDFCKNKSIGKQWNTCFDISKQLPFDMDVDQPLLKYARGDKNFKWHWDSNESLFERPLDGNQNNLSSKRLPLNQTAYRDRTKTESSCILPLSRIISLALVYLGVVDQHPCQKIIFLNIRICVFQYLFLQKLLWGFHTFKKPYKIKILSEMKSCIQ